MKKLIVLFGLVFLVSLFILPVQAKNRVNNVIHTEIDTVNFDVGIEDFRPDTVIAGDTFHIQVDIRNYGHITFPTFCLAFETNWYSDTIFISPMAPGALVTVDFGFFVAPDSGLIPVKCTLCVPDENQANNGGIFVIVVLPRPAIHSNDTRQTPRLKTSVMTITQFRSQVLNSKFKPEIYTPAGRRLRLEKIKKGIYFVKTNKIQKIVLLE